jgi:SAM-dependent methyltransferase
VPAAMTASPLVNFIGFPATLIHGDTLVLDRWLWLKARLPITRNGERLLDVGCGSGAFTIGAAKRGYQAVGLTWDQRENDVAVSRAAICKAPAEFQVYDVRALGDRTDLKAQFDVAVCCENIEHVLDDFKLMRAIAACLKPGGRLLLTAPYSLYRPMSAEDLGPFSKVEDGWHVRRGYSSAMLEELCAVSGLVPERVSFCSGILSQQATTLMRALYSVNRLLGWSLVLPLRIFPPLLDPLLTGLFRWPYYSICLEAYKPRHDSAG